MKKRNGKSIPSLSSYISIYTENQDLFFLSSISYAKKKRYIVFLF